LWSHGKGKLEEFLAHLNNMHHNIKFTMELEENNSLPFLDVLLLKKSDGSLGHTVYRKKTNTSRYLNAQSHHHPSQKRSVLKTLTTRSIRLTDHDHYNQEVSTLHDTFERNGYSNMEINQVLNQKYHDESSKEVVEENEVNELSQNQSQDKEENKNKALLPYVRGVTDRISKVLQRYEIRTNFTTHLKINQLLNNNKSNPKLGTQGVYEVPCGGCSDSYIGQTSRRMSTRIQEHKNAVKYLHQDNALAIHAKQTGHGIDFDNARSLANINMNLPRVFREAIEISKRPSNLNTRDDSQIISSAWKPVIKPLEVRDRNRISAEKTSTIRNEDKTPLSCKTQDRITRSQTKQTTTTTTMRSSYPST
jgi:hypothetical protein